MHAVSVSDREVAGLDELWLFAMSVADPKSAERIVRGPRHGEHPLRAFGDGDMEYLLA